MQKPYLKHYLSARYRYPCQSIYSNREFGLNFVVSKKNKIYHHGSKEHRKVGEIASLVGKCSKILKM